MKFNIFKSYAKYGLFLIFIISLAGTAYAETNQLVYYNWSENTGNTIVDNLGHGNNGTNNGNTTFILPTGQMAGHFDGQNLSADTGNTIVDNSGHGNNGINNGSTSFSMPTGQLARHFNGKNRITIPNNEQLSFTDPNITFGVFFRCNYSNPTYTYLASKGNNSFRISIDHSNSTISYEFYAEGHAIYNYSESYIQPNKDYEAIVTYDGSHAQLYINGVPDGNGVNYTAAALDPSNDTDWTIGSFPDSTYGLNGTIYASYLYDRTLSPSEIFKLYASDIRSINKLDNKGWGIALSWDDSAHIESCYPYLPLFQKYNATCTINVNSVINRPQTVKDQLKGLHSAGWEIACHGYNHQDSRFFLNNNTPAVWLNQEIFPNIEEIIDFGYPVYTLAYPYSSRDPTTDAILAPHFRTLRTRTPDVVNKNVNETTLAYYKWDNAQLLYGIEIDDQSGGVSLESIEYGIDRAKETGTVLVLYGHFISPGSVVSGRYMTSESRLDAILNYTNRSGGVFYHMGNLGNSSWESRYPTAKFTVAKNNILAGESVTFVDYSNNQITELLDFGDGSPTSSNANVNHTYTTPGIYTAKLTVTNEVSSNSMLQTITVIQQIIPVANFTSNSTTGSRPLNIAFTDTSIGLPTSWSWDFGDGGTSNDQNSVHEYSKAGVYSVALTVANEKGSNYTPKVNYISVLPQSPSSDFCSKITSGNIPLTVQFNDTSTESPTSWNWDFGDGNNSTAQNPTHTYSTAGNYNVCLVVKNANGSDSKTVTINVPSQSSSNDGSSSNSNGKSGSSSGRSGDGGGGGSPEPAKNVEVKELSQAFITSGNPVKFDFLMNATSIVYVSFDSKKTAGKTTTIAEMLKGKSTLISGLPSDEVYKSLNIWVGNSGFAIPKNIENAVVGFKVEKSWIQDKKIDKSSITLKRYSDQKWNQLPTSLLSEDEKYLYFTAQTPGFSPFAITGKTTASRNGIQPATGNKTQTKPNAVNTAANVEQTPEQKQSPNTSGKESTKMPGFEAVCGIVSLLTVFLHQRK